MIILKKYKCSHKSVMDYWRSRNRKSLIIEAESEYEADNKAMDIMDILYPSDTELNKQLYNYSLKLIK